MSALRSDAQAIVLTDRPLAANDGVLWAGRGATVALQSGTQASWGPLRMQFAPVLFYTQNADFALTPNGTAGEVAYRDPRFPSTIDLPQRFGDAGFARWDLGDSFLEGAAFGLVSGLSNARQHWGPARSYPLVLGTGSGGFGHFHISSDGAIGTWLGDAQFRLLLGKLEQSPYSPRDTGQTARFLSAFTASLRPRFAPAVEVGVTRLVNGPWPDDGPGLRLLFRPFEGVINDNVGPINQNPDNGFASVFLRLAPAGAGFEAYGELSREDFAGDVRQLYLEPDDLVQYTLGVARSRLDGGRLTVLRAEVVNGEVAHHDRGSRTLRRPIPPYAHSQTRQGLTNRGQLLGSFAAYGGAGATLAWERFTDAGRVLIGLERTLIHDWLPALGPTGGVSTGEVRYSLRGELLRFRESGEWAVTVAPQYTLNRALVQGRDVIGLELQARWRGF